jgi:hypothetical protein
VSAEPTEPPLGEPVEHTPIDLLAGPHDKVSITMPAALKARVAEAAAARGTNFSSYIAEVLAREDRRLALIDFLDHMDEHYGPPTDDDMAETDRRLEAMWARYEAYLSARSS